MNLIFHNNQVHIQDINYFQLQHVFESGQTFRWQKQSNNQEYIGIAQERVLQIKYCNDHSLLLNPCNQSEFKNIWEPYFDFRRDYSTIYHELIKDSILRTAVEYGWGIRLLNQDPWESLISFILSSNNGIPRIKKIIQLLCSRYGKEIYFNDQKYYLFPDPRTIASLSVKDLLECGMGYRGIYIFETSKMIHEGFPLYDLKTYGYQYAKQMLLTLPGVGPKVANCILLFSLGYKEAFPVDVWIKRTIELLYNTTFNTPEKAQDFATDHYGKFAGFAQQYMFFYAREIGIGKK